MRFARTKIQGIYYALESGEMLGRRIPKNALICVEGYTIKVCTHFPAKYEGKNPKLHVAVFDRDFCAWEDELWPIRDQVSCAMWRAWQVLGRPVMQWAEIIDFNNGRAVRYHKGGRAIVQPRSRNEGEIALCAGEAIISKTFDAIPHVPDSVMY